MSFEGIYMPHGNIEKRMERTRKWREMIKTCGLCMEPVKVGEAQREMGLFYHTWCYNAMLRQR